MKDLSKGSFLILEAAGFVLILIALSFGELLDLPSLFFGQPPSPASLSDIIFECSCVGFVGIVVLLSTWKLYPESKIAVSLPQVTVCAVCQKVCREGKWMSFSAFVEEGSAGSFTHGICPECMDTYYKGVTDTTAINYRHLLRGRKTN